MTPQVTFNPKSSVPPSMVDAARWADAVWPVGALFISALPTLPDVLFDAGTWTRVGNGCTLVGVNESDTDFATPLLTGGSKTITPVFTGTALGTHTHDVSTAVVGATDVGTPSGTVGSTGAGTPTGTLNSVSDVVAWPAGVPTFAGSALAGHTHTFTGSAVTSGAASAGATGNGATASTLTLGNHTHQVTAAGTNNSISAGTPAGTVAWPAGVPTNTGHTHTFTGSALAGHTHTFTGADLGTHTHTVTGSSGAASSGTPAGTIAAHSIVQPFLTVYIWQRIA